MTIERQPPSSVLVWIFAACVLAAGVLVGLMIGCHDADRPSVVNAPGLHDALPGMPDTPVYYITVTDPQTGEPLATVKVSDNPARTGTDGTRQSIANAIRHVGAMYERQDVTERAADVRFWFETTDDLRRKGGGGVTCTCGSLACDPSVCGRACDGPCGNCFNC